MSDFRRHAALPLEASTCPNYGGHRDSLSVLELAGGMALRYGLKSGDTITF
jgi:uncharacterized membrane protein (UPF0127 family)